MTGKVFPVAPRASPCSPCPLQEVRLLEEELPVLEVHAVPPSHGWRPVVVDAPARAVAEAKVHLPLVDVLAHGGHDRAIGAEAARARRARLLPRRGSHLLDV